MIRFDAAALAAALLALAPLVALAQESFDERFRQALALSEQGRFEQAETSLLALEEERPNDPHVAFRLGLLLLRKGAPQEAAERLESAAKALRFEAGVWLALSRAQLLIGSGEQARDAADRATAALSTTSGPQLYVLLARHYRALDEPEEAVEVLQRGLQSAPDAAPLYLDLAQLFLDHRTPEAAIALLASGVRRLPANPELHRLRGLAYYSEGLTGQAIDAFLEAIRLAPQQEIYYASLETALPEAGERLPEIVRALDAFSIDVPDSPIGPYLLALASQAADPGTARDAPLLREAIRRRPAFWPARFELAQALERRGRLEEALAELEEAVGLEPTHAPTHYALARIYAKTGDRTAAKRARNRHHELMGDARRAAAARRRQLPRLAITVR